MVKAIDWGKYDTPAPASPTPSAVPAAVPSTPAPDAVNPEAETTVGGLARSVVSGVRSGVEGLAGAGGDLFNWEKRKAAQLAKYFGADPETVYNIMTYGDEGNTRGPGVIDTPAVQGATDTAVQALPQGVADPIQNVTRYQPQTKAEEIANTAGSFLPDVIAPGGPARRLMRVAVPTAAVEGAGSAAEALAPEYEDMARMVAGLVAGGGLAAKEAGGFRSQSAIRAVQSNPKALARVQKLLEAQGMSPDQAADAMRQLGPASTPMDTGPVTRQEGQQIQARGGEGRAIIDKTLRERNEGINTRLEADVETAVGPRLQPSAVEQALKDRAADISKDYPEAHRLQTKPVDSTGIMDSIDAELARTKSPSLRNTLQKVRDSLHLMDQQGIVKKPNQAGELEAVPDPSSEGMHEARKAIDDMLYDQTGKPRDLGGNEARVLKDLRKQIDDAVADVGPIKDVDERFRQVKKEEQAFETGQKTYQNEQGMPTEVEFKQAYDAMSPGEQARVLEGLNVETYRQLGINANDLTTLKKNLKSEGKWNQQKVAAVIGDQKATALMNAVSREKTFSETYQKVVQGSKTAESLPGDGDSSLPGVVADVAVGTGIGGPTGGFAAAVPHLRKLLARAMTGKPGKNDEAVARLLASNRGDDIAEAMRLAGEDRDLAKLIPFAAIQDALLARQQELSERRPR